MMHLPTPGFLLDDDATPARLEQAVALNHRDYYVHQARAAQLTGVGEVHEANGVTWTDPGPDLAPMILFPRLDPYAAGDTLDRIIQFYREREPRQLVGCWSLDPTTPPDLDIRLLARGFQTGWRPRWMALDVRQLQEYPRPAGLSIESVEGVSMWDAPDLPYYSRATAALDHAMTRLEPRRVWHFVAGLNDQPVGHSTLFLTTGPFGVAGIYNVGVVPQARNRGIGKAITAAACLHAASLGCRYALLNATGERMYRQLGFQHIGDGWTWWLNVPRLNANPPSRQRIALAEAVGRGDTAALDGLARQGLDDSLDTPLTNGMTLVELAAHSRQPGAADWLLRHGATFALLPAWDIGWQDRVIDRLRHDPDLANQRSGDRRMTPLHAAVERGDGELARVILAAHPDLSIRDAAFGATALDWARHLQRADLIALIEAHQANPPHRDSSP